jgi:hypothetical protein
LVIFLAVAIILVGRFQASLSVAREATLKYELSEALSNMLTSEAVTIRVARYVQQLFQAALVNVIYYPTSREARRIVASEPQDGKGEGKPDRLLPILNAWGLVGEIQIWRGEYGQLPSEDSQLLQNFAAQAARGLERAGLIESKLVSSSDSKLSTHPRG